MKEIVNAYWQGSKLYLFHRQNEKVIQEVTLAEHSCFIDKKYANEPLLKSKHVKVINERNNIRVIFFDRELLKRVTASNGKFDQAGIKTFEADVSPVRRYLTDNEVKIQRPKICYLDLETDSRCKIVDIIEGKGRILNWALFDEEVNPIGYGCLVDNSDEAEIELLDDLWNNLFNFDLVAAWGGDKFDFPVLKNRSKVLKYKPKFDSRRLLYLDHLEIFKRMNIMAAKSGDEKQSLALNNVAQAVLGYGKKPFDRMNTWEEWAAGGERRQNLIEYNIHDAKLMPLIDKKTGYIDIHLTICDSCWTLPDSRGAKPTNFVLGFVMKMASKKDIRFRTRDFSDKKLEKFAGALVTEPRKGIHKSVQVCDFASMYPSIIRTFNMSPETFGSGDCIAPKTNVKFRTDIDGILPAALEEVMRLRDHWKKIKAKCPPGSPEWREAHRRTAAFKTTANSFYGVAGCTWSSLFEREVAESTSLVGVWLLEKTREFAEQLGYNNIYGDTDSCMITNISDDEMKEFCRKCNEELYPKLLKEQGCKYNFIKIAYAQKFRRIIFLAKKHYVASIEHSEGVAPEGFESEIKGLSVKRGDSLRLGRQMQLELIDLLLKEECEDIQKIENFILTWKKKILEGELSLEDILMTKKISRKIDEYICKVKVDGTMSLPPAHVQVAKILMERGYHIPEGTRVEYIIKDGYKRITAIPLEDFTGEFDRYYLWMNLVYKPNKAILEAAFPGYDWKKYTKCRPKPVDPNQLSLF